MSLSAVKKIKEDAFSLAGVELSDGTDNVVIQLEKDDSLTEQGYSLTVDNNGISIKYKDEQGAYYASATLYQIFWQVKDEIPYLNITNDHPDFKYRAFDMDISRNRLPKVETVKRVINMMSNLKYNQLFLYLEGFSYAYDSYPQVWSGGEPMTPEQVKELSDYAKERGIDLIPAQNSFGHSYQWIQHNDFKKLGDTDTSSTLNVLDPQTQNFLSNMYDDLYTNGFQSDFLQVGGDETNLDLEYGRTAATWRQSHPVEEPTQETLYLESMNKIYEIATSKGKQMLYWADMIIHYDLYEKVQKTMPDAIAMDWGYLYDYNFDASTSKLKEAGIPFYVCAGDSSWSTIVGNTYVMNKNAENAAFAGKKNGALGYAMTNWGDAGHYQNIITTYPAIAYGGGLSWCYDTNTKDKNSYDEFLNMFLYQDSTNTLSQAYSKLADFSNDYLPYGWNGNWIANCMVEPWTDSTHKLWEFMDFQENGNDNVINEKVRDMALDQCASVSRTALDFLTALENTNMQAEDAELLYKEFKNTAKMTKIAADYTAMRLRLFTGGDIDISLTTKEQEKDTAIQNAQEFQTMIEDFKDIWEARDVYGELPSTLGWISKPAMMYRDIAGVENIYKPQPDGNLFLKTPETIGLNLSIDDFVVNGWTWTNYGTGMPAIANTYMGGEGTSQLRSALKQNVFSIVNNVDESGNMTFAYNSKAAIDGGFYENNPDWGPLLPRCGWPAVIPHDGNYFLSVRLKYKTGREINGSSVALSGSANKKSDGNLMDIPQNPTWEISQPDENGWYDVKIKFSIADAAGISFGILPQNNVQDDTLYIRDLVLKEDIPEVLISSDHPAYTAIDLNSQFTVPEAKTNGTMPIEINLSKPDGQSVPVSMGDKVLADAYGIYRLTYTSKEASNTLHIVFEVKQETDNLIKINDENATGFTSANQFFALVNPYYEGNYGFNNQNKLISYGNDTPDPSRYASLITNEEGGNGQVILLDTQNLPGNNKVSSINFCAEVTSGKTYRLHARMKYWRAEMDNGLDLGPFQTGITFFNNEITDRASDANGDDQWQGYKYVESYLTDEQKELARSGQWFDYDVEFTVPEAITIHGEQKTPTAVNTFFMTSSNAAEEDHHKMWIDDVTLKEVKEDVFVVSVEQEEDILVNYGTDEKDISLPEKVIVNVSDGTQKELQVTWNSEDYDGNRADNYKFTGTLICPQGIINKDNINAYVNVTVKDKEHHLTAIDEKHPTCTEDGHIAYWYCENCKKYFKDESCKNEITKEGLLLKALGHGEMKIINKKDATTKQDGYSGDVVCGRCGKVIQKGDVLEKIKQPETEPIHKEEIVKTGVTQNVVLPAVVFIIAACGILFLWKKKR